MRLNRAVVPAVVVAVLWLISGGLELLGRQSLTGPVRRILSLVAPETIPVQELTAPAPWAFIMTALSMLAIAAAYAALLALVRRQPAVAEPTTGSKHTGQPQVGGFAPYRGRTSTAEYAPTVVTADNGQSSASAPPGNTATAFAAYWLCAVASAFLVVAIPMVGEVGVEVIGGQSPFSFATERLAGAAQWGLVFGWIPALVAIALDEGARDQGAPQRQAIVVAAAVVFLLAALGLGVAAPQARAAVQAEIQAENVSPQGPESPQEPIPTGTPVPLVAPGDWQVDPLWCTSGQLAMTAGMPDAAAGSRGMVIHAQNVSDAACVVESYPDVAFSNAVTSAIEVEVDHGGGMLGSDPGVTRIELQPGAEVVATLTWSAMPRGDAAGWLYVAGYHGAERQMVQVETDITGGTVSVTAWGLPAA
ncbi:MAG: DUF4232 domain-containing protein [Jiangellaceae bacterium]